MPRYQEYPTHRLSYADVSNSQFGNRVFVADADLQADSHFDAERGFAPDAMSATSHLRQLLLEVRESSPDDAEALSTRGPFHPYDTDITVRALYTHLAFVEDELSYNKGDVVRVLEANRAGDVWRAEFAGKVGFVKAKCFTYDNLPTSSVGESSLSRGASEPYASSASTSPFEPTFSAALASHGIAPFSYGPLAPQLFAIANAPFLAAGPNEMSLDEGEIVEIVTTQHGRWWYGCNQAGAQGYFPADYVSIMSSTHLSAHQQLSQALGGAPSNTSPELLETPPELGHLYSARWDGSSLENLPELHNESSLAPSPEAMSHSPTPAKPVTLSSVVPPRPKKVARRKKSSASISSIKSNRRNNNSNTNAPASPWVSKGLPANWELTDSFILIDNKYHCTDPLCQEANDQPNRRRQYGLYDVSKLSPSSIKTRAAQHAARHLKDPGEYAGGMPKKSAKAKKPAGSRGRKVTRAHADVATVALSPADSDDEQDDDLEEDD